MGVKFSCDIVSLFEASFKRLGKLNARLTRTECCAWYHDGN